MHRRLNSNLKQSRALITFHSLAETYMYDDSIATNNYSNVHQQHWYDEPPYESDPDDFLMAGMGGAAATIQVCKENISSAISYHPIVLRAVVYVTRQTARE